MSSTGIRTARAVLGSSSGLALRWTLACSWQSWLELLRAVEPLPTFDRTRLSDDEVRAWIRDRRKPQPGSTNKSASLRRLREQWHCVRASALRPALRPEHEAAPMKVLRRRALCIEQTKSGPLYLFTLRADEIFEVAEVDAHQPFSIERADRLPARRGPAARRGHPRVPRRRRVLFPNAIILALTPSVRFRRSRDRRTTTASPWPAMLEIPLPASGGEAGLDRRRPAARPRARRSGARDFPVPVSAFVADTVESATRPVPADQQRQAAAARARHRTLPRSRSRCRARSRRKQVPSALCDLLNTRADSPFYGLIRRASTPRGQRRGGHRHEHHRDARGEPDVAVGMPVPVPQPRHRRDRLRADLVALLVVYWTARAGHVPRRVGQAAEQSRLMHGVGIRAMGR